MCTDCRHENDWIVRVTERTAGSEIVGGGAGRSRHTDAICLDGGEVLVIAEELE